MLTSIMYLTAYLLFIPYISELLYLNTSFPPYELQSNIEDPRRATNLEVRSVLWLSVKLEVISTHFNLSVIPNFGTAYINYLCRLMPWHSSRDFFNLASTAHSHQVVLVD